MINQIKTKNLINKMKKKIQKNKKSKIKSSKRKNLKIKN